MYVCLRAYIDACVSVCCLCVYMCLLRLGNNIAFQPPKHSGVLDSCTPYASLHYSHAFLNANGSMCKVYRCPVQDTHSRVLIISYNNNICIVINVYATFEKVV